MQRGGIEIGAIGPHQRLDLGIDYDTVEQLEIPQWSIQFTCQDRSKIDGLLCVVIKTDAKSIRRDHFERANSMDGMIHRNIISTVLRDL